MTKKSALVGLMCNLMLACLSMSAVSAAELRYGSKGIPVSFGNPYMANGSPSNYVWAAMFDALTQIDAQGKLQPALALSWENIEPKAWRFKLRPNITFSNGEPLTAEAVVTAIAWLKTPEGRRSVIGNEIRDVLAAERVDDLTVIIRSERPDAILPQRLSAVFLVAPKAWTTMGPERFAKTPATTGSYALKDWGEGTGRVVLNAFKQSWRSPVVEKLTVMNLPDNAARLQALQSKQIDIAGNINVDDMDSVEMFGGRVVSGSSASVMSIAFRVTDGPSVPLKDVRVRQAINYAVDKSLLNKSLLRGLTTPTGQPAARGVMGYDPTILPYPYDVAKAKALMKAAGYEQGFGLKIDVIVDRTPGDAAIYQTVADMLSKIGIKVELRTLPFPTWLTKYLTGTWDKDTDAFSQAWNAGSYNDVARPMEIFSCRKPFPYFCDQALTERLVAANEEMNLGKRETLLKDLGRGYHDAAPALYLLDLNDFFAVRAGIENVEIVNRVPAYHKISISKVR
jgi:peptide/nickel transport system substrate-binding protein